MTHAARLDANANLSFTRGNDGPLYEVKDPGFRYFNRSIRFSHFRLLSICGNCFVFVHRNFGSSDCFGSPKPLLSGQAKGQSQTPEKMEPLLRRNPEFSGKPLEK